MEDEDLRVCSECEKKVPRSEMSWTYDCQGIAYRLLCNECWEKAMATNGYDGEYYNESDECLDYDY